MKIGVVGPIWLNIPARAYGGTEEVVYNLVNGLVDKGHDVTLFGPGTAKTKAKLVPTFEKPLLESEIGWNDYAAINYHMHHYLEAFKQAEKFDVLHIHLNKNHDYESLPMAVQSRTPVIFTLHFPAPTPTYRPEKYMILSQFKHLPFTSISNAARSGNKWNFIRTIYNSIRLEQFTYSETADDYFAWLGKALPIKGLKEAILAAQKAKVKLKIMAAIDTNNPTSITYFKNEVKPLIDGKMIEYLGEANMEKKVKVLRRAKAMLNPILWPEPFGLVMAESQAVGTPVISFDKGAASELIKDGKTGYLVDTIDEMVAKMKIIDEIDRKACRKHVEDMFGIAQMIDGYEKAYEKTIQNWETYRSKQKKALHFS